MKVVLFVNGFPDARKPSNGIFNLRTATELAKRVELTVVVPQAMRPGRPLIAAEYQENMTVVRIAGPVILGAPRLTLRLYRRFTASRLEGYFREADIVHSVGVEFAGVLAGALRNNLRYLHLTQLINDLRYLKEPRFERFPYLRILRRNLHGVLCNSRALEETARMYFPEVNFVRTAYRGTDLALFTPSPADSEEPKPMRFLFLGGLPLYPERLSGANYKGGLTLMEAWKLGEEEFRHHGSTLFFGGPSSTSEPARRWIKGLKHPEAVKLGGMVTPAEVPAHLRAAGMVLIPSIDEGCPNLAFEALACGKAVLASDIGPLKEVIAHGECGLTVPAGNARALKDAMVEYSKPWRREEIRAMEVAARARAERLFDCRNYAQALVSIYGELATQQEKWSR